MRVLLEYDGNKWFEDFPVKPEIGEFVDLSTFVTKEVFNKVFTSGYWTYEKLMEESFTRVYLLLWKKDNEGVYLEVWLNEEK